MRFLESIAPAEADKFYKVIRKDVFQVTKMRKINPPYISKLEFYFLGLPQPQKAPESRQNPGKYESEKVRSPFLERLGLNFHNIHTHYKIGN